MRKVQWGVLGVAGIATRRVIPAMKHCENGEVAAIASRSLAKAQAAAKEFGIPKAYGSYEELLADPDIEAVYNPLPNHLHVPMSIRAAEAGKHVLCEKPVGLDAADVRKLIAVRDRTGMVVGEAFMVATHPQWLRTAQLVREGRIGKLRFAIGNFGYGNMAPENVRNVKEWGGGGLLDIGCYPIKTSRMIFGEEPVRVAGALVRDPKTGVDVLGSAILEYPSGQCAFTFSTEVGNTQRMQFSGSAGRIEIEIPFNAPTGETSRIIVDDCRDLTGTGRTVEEFAACDQYGIQADVFSKAVREGTAPAVPLEDSVRNMAVIDAIFRAAERGTWEPVETTAAAHPA
jgi:predicted dehydrogenase